MLSFIMSEIPFHMGITVKSLMTGRGILYVTKPILLKILSGKHAGKYSARKLVVIINKGSDYTIYKLQFGCYHTYSVVIIFIQYSSSLIVLRLDITILFLYL